MVYNDYGMKRWMVCFIVLSVPMVSLAQKKYVEAQAAVGSANIYGRYSLSNLLFQYPFEGPYVTFTVGSTVNYRPVAFPFFVSGGIVYQRRQFRRLTTNHLQVPLGIELLFGNKCKISFGGGGYAGVLMRYRYQDLPTFEESKTILQWGAYVKLGGAVKISERYDLAIHLLQMMDLTTLYQTYRYSPGGGKMADDHFPHVSQVSISFRRYFQR